ncbi:MAG: transcription termination factor Rho [Verrucomicrobiaceae bacterium]|nr:transcription termination factor Rho [Verrucomicrobiaceae bacterium]
MSEDTTSDSPFPPAPETHQPETSLTRRTAKKAAKKATKKVPVAEKAPAEKKAPAAKKTAAKKAVAATKKAAKKKAVVEVETPPPPAPEPVVEAPPAEPVAEAKPKRPSRKKAKAVEEAPAPEIENVEIKAEVVQPVAESAPAPAPAPAPALQPVTEAPAEQPSAPSSSDADVPAEAGESSSEAGGEPAAGGEERPGRRLRWWERRKLERQARAAARAAAGGGPPNGGHQGKPQGNGGEGRHQHQQHQPRQPQQPADSDFEDRSPSVPLGPPEPAEGLLELSQKGHGFLRLKEKGWNQLPTDVFVHGDVIRKCGLRDGMYIKGQAQKGSRGMQLTEVSSANGLTAEELRDLPLFEELKAVNPAKRYQLETSQDRMTTRVIDMMTPVGRGQRGLIVSPPRAGKTTIMQHIAEAITKNYPQVHLMILLVDERPEEVTEFKRSLPNAELYASSNDQDAKSHARIAELAINRAKRLVEQGTHVFMLMDSITRLARAFNNLNKGGATMSGGMGVGSMEVPRRLFAAARNTRTAGSLTILATALVETGSRMDDLIFQEFKGTGNMELVLDRKIAEQYIYPAVNIFKSGTRREELLLQGFQIEKIHFLRRGLAGHKPIEAVQRVLSLLERYPNNAQMLLELSSKEK